MISPEANPEAMVYKCVYGCMYVCVFTCSCACGGTYSTCTDMGNVIFFEKDIRVRNYIICLSLAIGHVRTRAQCLRGTKSQVLFELWIFKYVFAVRGVISVAAIKWADRVQLGRERGLFQLTFQVTID